MSEQQLLLGKHRDTAKGKVRSAVKMGREKEYRVRCLVKSVELRSSLSREKGIGRCVLANMYLYPCPIINGR